MSRKEFIASLGATCKNWTWSWSFIDEPNKRIIFGAWDIYTEGGKALILDEAWRIDPKGATSKGYPQSREHVRLIEEEGYRLFIFPIIFGGYRDNGTSIMKGFTPEISEKKILRIGKQWYAGDSQIDSKFAEEITRPEIYTEGTKKTITVNSYERSPKARAACIAHHGLKCSVCTMNFESRYGELGKGFIHVHHIVPIGSIKEEYKIDPIKDLMPVCPNCHAMIHQTEPPLSIAELKKYIK